MRSIRLFPAFLATLALTACAPSTPSASSAAPETEPVRSELFAMDTVMDLTVYGTDPAEGEALLADAEAEIRHLEGLLSVTDPDSEIYAADHSGGVPVPLSEDTADLVAQALTLCERTGGALDISIYPVVRAWGFTTGDYRVPEEEELQSLLRAVDWTRIRLDGDRLTVPDGMEIDLGAVAKGYTGDRLMDLFRDRGVTSALVSLGGNIQALGSKPDGSAWRVALQDPDGDGYAGVVELRDEAAITSGGYERYFEENGVRYWHIIDPADGHPARSGVASATIVGPSGIEGDALSTALFLLGPERAADCWRANDGFDYVLLLEDGTVQISEGLEDRFSLYGDWEGRDLTVIRR